jgi:hypothetical protein
MLGLISTTGQNCGNYTPPVTPAITAMPENHLNSGASLFNVYPNPSTGLLFIELNPDQKAETSHVEVMSMQGTQILSFVFNNERKHQISISALPAGVYFLRLTIQNMVETTKVIKLD